MKAEIYNALASLNRGFEVVLESMKVLQENGIISAEFSQEQYVMTEQLRAAINYMVTNKLHSRESEDCDHFGKMRATIEAKGKNHETIAPARRSRQNRIRAIR